VCLSSVLIERLLDGILLILWLYSVTFFVEVPGFLRDASLVLAVVVGILSVVAWTRDVSQGTMPRRVSRSRWKDALWHVVEGLHAMGNSPTFLPAVAVSMMYLASRSSDLRPGQGSRLDITLGASAVVLVILRIGTVLPRLQACWGIAVLRRAGTPAFRPGQGRRRGLATLLF